MNMKGTIQKKILGVLAIAGALAVIVWAVGCRKILGTVPAWWASDYRAFRVERSGWLTRLRPGINLELSGLQDRRSC